MLYNLWSSLTVPFDKGSSSGLVAGKAWEEYLQVRVGREIGKSDSERLFWKL